MLLVVITFFSSSFIAIAGLTGYIYRIYQKTIPDLNRLNQWQVAEATRIYDSEGNLLYEIYDKERRYVISSNEIADSIKKATVAIEDQRFYDHHGIDFRGLVRAAYFNTLAHSWQQGGSTITQQLVKNSYLTPERTVERKVQEIIFATELEKRYSKDEILTMYLNTVGYGSNAYGVAAASQMYFHKSAHELNTSEAALLAAMTKSPTGLTPYGPNRLQLEERKNHVLAAMAKQNLISPFQLARFQQQLITIYPKQTVIQAPHFVMYIKQQLIDQYGHDLVERGGLQVITTLRPSDQQSAEAAITEAAPNLDKAGAQNAAMVALDPQTGAIRAMVGSRNYFDAARDGNVNVTTRLRQPGSAFKPIVYANAFARGPWSPGSTIYDVATDFGSDSLPYIPNNYDGKSHGPVSLREALANSYNIPAVKLLALIGKDTAIDTAEKLGISTFHDRDRLGLSLVIGGGDVKLLELAGAYGSFANQGIYLPPYGVQEITRHGQVIAHTEPRGKAVFPPQVAYQISSILSDQSAREPVFGRGGPLTLPGKTAAVKTGTTQDYRDAWTIGYTPTLVTGVWVGNNDFSPMHQGSAGAMAAAPIWNSFMTKVLAQKGDEPFVMPTGFETLQVDTLTGKRPSGATVATRQDLFTEWQKPTDSPPPTYQITQCQNSAAFHTLSFIQSEQPTNPKWEFPVLNWARQHGMAWGTTPSPDACRNPVVQLAAVPTLPRR